MPGTLLRSALIPVVPDRPRLRCQAVHSLDVGDAYRRALLSDARGAFNLAADPVIGSGELAAIFHARRVRFRRRCSGPERQRRLRCVCSRPSRTGSTWAGPLASETLAS